MVCQQMKLQTWAQNMWHSLEFNILSYPGLTLFDVNIDTMIEISLSKFLSFFIPLHNLIKISKLS